MPMDTETYKALGLHLPPTTTAKPASKGPYVPEGDKQYNPCADAYPGEDVSVGTVTHIKDWMESSIFPATYRDIYIYTPANLDQVSEAPSLAFFNDGAGYVDAKGPVRAAKIFDSLIHAGELPPTVGVFVNPGQPIDKDASMPVGQRSFEYDSVTPLFINFINEEILPLVEKYLGRALHTDPAQRLICGISSGGICAFNAAWHSPESFGLVLSHCGSFTNIRGGHNFPYMVRSTDAKPIKVFLQSGEQDLNIVLGSWAIANQDMAAALEYSGYEYKFFFGEGAHSLRHGGAIFADSLRWLFGKTSESSS